MLRLSRQGELEPVLTHTGQTKWTGAAGDNLNVSSAEFDRNHYIQNLPQQLLLNVCPSVSALNPALVILPSQMIATSHVSKGSNGFWRRQMCWKHWTHKLNHQPRIFILPVFKRLWRCSLTLMNNLELFCGITEPFSGKNSDTSESTIVSVSWDSRLPTDGSCVKQVQHRNWLHIIIFTSWLRETVC